MQPRILSRTHYQVDEPAHMTLLCKLCASGAQSAYREVLAKKLADVARAQGKEFNVAAGGYAVDLARALGLLSSENALADRGHLVNLIAQVKDGSWEEQLTLTQPEVLLYLHLFLEADGAAFIFLGRRFLEKGTLPGEDASWNLIATEMFAEVYLRYLEISNNTADRVHLRQQRDRILAKGYEGKGGAHKMFIHLQTLYRLGLLSRLGGSQGRVYARPQSPPSAANAVRLLVEQVPDIMALERIVAQRRWAQVAAEVLQLRHQAPLRPSEDQRSEILNTLVGCYDQVLSTGAPICSISTLVDAAQIILLTARRRLFSYESVLDVLTSTQKRRPKDVRFHVDRRGQPAYLKLSDEFRKSAYL